MGTNGLLIILSAPSGAGKSTLAKELLTRDANLGFSVSATTRQPRAGEVNGKDYLFITHDEFKRRVDAGEFLEWAQVHNNCYGTLKSEVARMRAAGRDVLLDIDVQGGLQLKQRGEEGLFIFIAPPSMQVLEQRLRGRGTNSDEDIAVRLANAQAEMDRRGEYDAVIVNDAVERALGELQQVINAARTRLAGR
ncbi:MAG TPA: guanylate kinase [bacterium]|nr:guanylate kinase [bacterium]